jgi:hypothetical protein
VDGGAVVVAVLVSAALHRGRRNRFARPAVGFGSRRSYVSAAIHRGVIFWPRRSPKPPVAALPSAALHLGLQVARALRQQITGAALLSVALHRGVLSAPGPVVATKSGSTSSRPHAEDAGSQHLKSRRS